MADQTTETKLPAVVGPSDILSAITDMARDPAIDPGKISALIDLHRSLQADQAKRAFDEAFAALSADLPRIKKNGTVSYPKDKGNPTGPMIKAFNYAKFEDIDEIVRPPMKAHGFHFSFDTKPQADGKIIIVGELHHSGGHSKTA